MMHLLVGEPGSGKGVIATKQIEDELATGSRVILTDSALRLDPWLRNVSRSSPWSRSPSHSKKYQAELGLLGYLDEKYGETFSASDRIYVFGEDESKEFYLRRYDIKQKKWIVLDAERDAKGRIETFDTLRRTYGALIITDEFWASAPAREWHTMAKGMMFYAAQHRKFGDEWFIVTQNTKQIDSQLRELAHDTWVVTNHSKLPIGPFRRPDKFTVKIYHKVPSGPSATPLRTLVYTLDKRGLGGCFDTAAGSGVSGGGPADLNEKKRGLPFWSLCVAVVLVILLLSQTPKLFAWAAGKFLPGRPKPAIAVQTNSVPVATGAPKGGFVDAVSSMFKSGGNTNSPGYEIPLPAPVLYCGYFFDGKKIRVMLSDGTMRTVRGEFRELDDGSVVLDGTTYARKSPEYVPDAPRLPVQTFQDSEEDGGRPSTTVTVIGKRNEKPLPNSRQSFFDNP